MSLDLDKVILASPYNSFKNDSVIHTGSLTFPTSLTAGQQAVITTTIPLTISPQFSDFYAFFTEGLDLSTYPNGTYGNNQWYPMEIAVNAGVGVWVTAPLANARVLNAPITPIISGNTIIVQTIIVNPYSNSITLAPLTVPFAFTQYSIAG